jgi:hypothetical protein
MRARRQQPHPHALAWGFFYREKVTRYFTVNIYVKIRKSLCENTVDLVDLQNTLDWS